MTKQTVRQLESLARLKELLPPGTTVYTTVTSVARSGMSRRIRFFVMQDCRPQDITWDVAQVIGLAYKYGDDGARISGCGMDMGLAAVYDLGRNIFPDGFKAWPGYWRNGPLEFDPDGGYGLKQSWL